MKSNANFHIHTNCSDGNLNIKQIIPLLLQEKINYFSITDHDSIDAYEQLFDKVELEKQLLIKDNLYCIPGIELSCCLKDGEISLDSSWYCHILGYNIDLNKMKLELKEIAKSKTKMLHDLCLHLIKDGYHIDLNNILINGNINSRINIAKELVNNGYSNNIDECFSNILNNDKYLVFSSSTPSIKEGIEIIHRCGGFAIWAHPFSLIRGGKMLISKSQVIMLLNDMIGYGLDGLECFYQKYDLDQINFLKYLADRHFLLQSVGTDFHGIYNSIVFDKDLDQSINFTLCNSDDISSCFKYLTPNKILIEMCNCIKDDNLPKFIQLLEEIDYFPQDFICPFGNNPYNIAKSYKNNKIITLLEKREKEK